MKNFIQRILLIAVLGIPAGLPVAKAGPDRETRVGWSKVLQGHRTREDDVPYFELIHVSESADGLTGAVSFNHDQLSGRRLEPVTIHGRISLDGRFWPNVELQVANHQEGPWKAVVSSNTVGSAPFILYPGLAALGFKVDLNAYRDLFGKYAYGRLVFENGSAADFSLDDLKP